MTTTRFPNGITNVPEGNPLGTLIDTDPIKMYRFFKDFSVYTASDWDLSAAPNLTATALDFPNGAINLSVNNSATQTFVSVNDTFQFTSGKQTWFSIGLFTTTPGVDLNNTDLIWGLSDGTDAIEFIFAQASDTLTIEIRDGSNITNKVVLNTGILFPTANVVQQFSFYYNGVDTVDFYIDEAQVGSLSAVNVPLDKLMHFLLFINTLSGDPVVLDIDYIFVGQER